MTSGKIISYYTSFGSKVHNFTFFSRATESQSCLSLWAKWRPQKRDHISRVWFGQPMAGRDHNMETQKLNQFGGPTSFSIGQKWRKWVVRKPMACQMSITTRYKRQFYKRWFIPLFIFYINYLYKHQCSITIFFFFLKYKIFGHDLYSRDTSILDLIQKHFVISKLDLI